MSGWGVSVIGMASVLETLDDLAFEFTTDAVYVVGSNVEYAVHVEYGTSRMSAQPYLRPAARQAERNIDKFASQASSGEELIKLIALDIEATAKRLVPVDTGNLKNSIKAEKIQS